MKQITKWELMNSNLMRSSSFKLSCTRRHANHGGRSVWNAKCKIHRYTVSPWLTRASGKTPFSSSSTNSTTTFHWENTVFNPRACVGKFGGGFKDDHSGFSSQGPLLTTPFRALTRTVSCANRQKYLNRSVKILIYIGLIEFGLDNTIISI